MNTKKANTAYPIHPLMEERWSPRAFARGIILDSEIHSLMEAARWAPSSMNEQPWRFIVSKNPSKSFINMLDTLMDTNKIWAKESMALIVVLARTTFQRDGSVNKHAFHDTGFAVGQICLQATSMGFHTHQLGGIYYDTIKEVFSVPKDEEVVCIIAVGKLGNPDILSEDLQKREVSTRQRKPIEDFYTFLKE
ncbi:MAG: nitroreductase family protein [Chitinophagaceae bacterium]|nr:nitroreductase family protein [Chitinophagaceae bacterium]